MRKILFILCFLPVLLMAQQVLKPKNVIFIVGDGMGTSQVYCSVVDQGANNSNFLRFPFSGFSRTYSNNKYTTDSGAGGSALMTGHKVDNYHIAQANDGTNYPSLFVKAHEQGLSTGFVVVCNALDATPAATYAHVPDRKMFDAISMQMALCSHDVMIGGNMEYWRPENRKDGYSPLDTLKARGYSVATTLKEVKHAKGSKLVALLSEKDPATQPARGEMLLPGVKKALDMLSRNDKGFALMIEGSQIDWAGHNNDSAYLVAEMRDFESMLGYVLDWAQKDGNTLVVVTADHETGGLALLDGSIQDRRSEMKFTTGGHSGVMVPVFSFGPGAERFSGIHQNIDIPHIISQLMNLNLQ